MPAFSFLSKDKRYGNSQSIITGAIEGIERMNILEKLNHYSDKLPMDFRRDIEELWLENQRLKSHFSNHVREERALGDFIKAMRGKRTIREISRLSGISHTFLSSLEKGVDPRTGNKIVPSPDTLHKLATALGVSPEKLMTEAGYFPREEEEWIQ